MHNYKGAIIAHIGPMFGGKSSAWIEYAKKFKRAKYGVKAFKFVKDDRYVYGESSDSFVMTHDGIKFSATNIKYIEEIIEVIENDNTIDVVAIDELQFLESSNGLDAKSMVELLLSYIFKNNKILLFSGLPLDSELKPFDIIKEILPYATHVMQHKSVCVDCGNDATTSFCKVEKETQELVGGDDLYEPLCITCYNDRKFNRK